MSRCLPRRSGRTLLVALCLAALTVSCGEAAPDASPTQSPSPGERGGSELRDRPHKSSTRKPSPSPSPKPTRPPATERPERPTLTIDGLLGADLSWPQCPKGMGIPEKRSEGAPLPIPEAEYWIIGLTNGPGFTPNPCLPDQVGLARERGLLVAAYAVSSFPDPGRVQQYADAGPFDGSKRLGALRNTGYQQARYNVTSMIRTGFETPIVWVDVEPVPSFDWSADRVANAAVIEGAVRGYRDAGYRVGVYSTPYLWDLVVGDLELGVAEWRAAGQTSRAEALNRCGPDWVIQGGPGVIGQWVADRRDHNVLCPGAITRLDRWFHQY